jgi:hypothetical protein
MIKETTILTGIDKAYDSVDAFYTENSLDAYRAQERAYFTDAGFDIDDSAKHQTALTEDSTKVKITVEYDDEAEQTAVFANVIEADFVEVVPVFVDESSVDHLF